METRKKVGFGGLGIDLMSGAALAWVGHQWLWIPFALGALVALWGLWPRENTAEAATASNSGAFAGRDNHGNQTVVHGDQININHKAEPGPEKVDGMFVHRSEGLAPGGIAFLSDKPPTPEYEPLPEASRRVLEANIGNMITEFAMHEKTPEDRLNWGAFWIAGMNHVPIYGKRPPLQRYELIPEKDVHRFYFRGGARLLGDAIGAKEAYWHDLAVKPEDLESRWEEICQPR